MKQALYKNVWCDVLVHSGYMVTIIYRRWKKRVDIAKIDDFRN